MSTPAEEWAEVKPEVLSGDYFSASSSGSLSSWSSPDPVHVWQRFQGVEPAPPSSNASSARTEDDDSPVLTEHVHLSHITHELMAPRPGDEPRRTEPSVAGAGAGAGAGADAGSGTGDGFKRTSNPVIASKKVYSRRSDTRKDGRNKSPRRTMWGPDAENRRGGRRQLPCCSCARKLALDTKWACHETMIGQYGIRAYQGTRCSECVGSHSTCHEIPPHAVDTVRALVEAADRNVEHMNRHGFHDMALHAAYEAAIGPALSALQGVGLQSMQRRKAQRPPATEPRPLVRKRRRIERREEESGRRGRKRIRINVEVAPPELEMGDLQPSHTLAPRVTPRGEKRRGGGRATMSRPRSPAAPQQEDEGFRLAGEEEAAEAYGMSAGQKDIGPDPERLERLERQALRRRKVQALEALAHTSALLLAELQTRNQNAAWARRRAGSATL